MKKVLLFIGLIFITQALLSQDITTVYDCGKIEKVIQYIKADIEFKGFFNEDYLTIKVEDSIYIGAVYDVFSEDYYAHKIELLKERLWILPDLTKDITQQSKLANKRYIKTYVDCLLSYNDHNPNVEICFTYIDDNTMQVNIWKITENPNAHTYGQFLLVCFSNEGNIDNIVKSNWIE